MGGGQNRDVFGLYCCSCYDYFAVFNTIALSFAKSRFGGGDYNVLVWPFYPATT
jgi:hypothetical protein